MPLTSLKWTNHSDRQIILWKGLELADSTSFPSTCFHMLAMLSGLPQSMETGQSLGGTWEGFPKKIRRKGKIWQTESIHSNSQESVNGSFPHLSQVQSEETLGVWKPLSSIQAPRGQPWQWDEISFCSWPAITPCFSHLLPKGFLFVFPVTLIAKNQRNYCTGLLCFCFPKIMSHFHPPDNCVLFYSGPMVLS